MLNTIIENMFVGRLAADLPRSPFQINRLHESDAEILSITHENGSRFAFTTDTIAEEISSGLYTDPWLIGWMTVMVNMSDLAAVGARPLGILVAETLPEDPPEEYLRALQKGIADACSACGTYVLGGDTNFARVVSMTACAVGIIENGRTLSRIGCSPGEILFTSGPLGGGSAFAFARLSGNGTPPPRYRPAARIREGCLLRSHASCCMDTSDGALATLDQLMRLNGSGFSLNPEWQSALDPSAYALAQHLGVPDWFVLAGEHGEFELLFTIPRRRADAFLDEAGAMGWRPIRIGHAIDEPRILVPSAQGHIPLDTAEIRNLAGVARRDIRMYLLALRELAERQQRSTTP
jgi:thiamine-monophosphate kinase